MPYAPGVQNISGEILARGQMQQAEGIAGGLTNWLKGYEQNEALKKQGLSTFTGILANNPELQQFMTDAEQGKKQVPPEVLKAFSNYKNKGSVDVYDASMLGNFANNFLQTKRDQQQQQLAAANLAHVTAQAGLINQQLEQQRRIQDFIKNIETEDQTKKDQADRAYWNTPATGGEEEGAAASAEQPIPSAKPAFQVSTPSPNAAVPPMLSRFATPAPTQQPAPPPQLTAFLNQPDQAMGRPSSAPTKQDYAQAMLDNPAGSPVTWSRAAFKMAEDRQKSYMSESVFTGPEGRAKSQALVDQLNRQGGLPEGMMYVNKFDGTAKGFYPELKEVPQTATQKEEATRRQVRATELEKAGIEEASTFVKDINSSAAQAIDDQARFNRIEELYRKKAESGKLKAWTLDAQTALAEAGFGDRAKTSNEQELRGLLAIGLQASKRYYKGQGSTSNEERSRIDQVVEAYNKGQITNESLIAFAKAHNRKLIKASQYDLSMKANKVPLDERGTNLQDWWLKNPVDKFMGDGTTEVYDINDEGILTKTKSGQTAAEQPTSAPLGQQPASIGRFKVIQVK